MTQLLALSFDGPTSPTIRLRAVEGPARSLDAAYGWGLAWYPSEGPAAMVVKDPTSVGTNALTRVLSNWERFSATVFLGHLRGAAKRKSHHDTQPFCRTWGGRDWVFGHNGDLRQGFRDALPLPEGAAFEPVGRTDSEHILCWLLEQLKARGIKRLRDVGPDVLCGWLRQVNKLGTLNCVLSDGDDVVVYSDAWGYRPLYWRRYKPPESRLDVRNDEITLQLGGAGDEARSSVIVSTQPLSDRVWCQLERGAMLVARRGDVVYHGEAVEPPWVDGDGWSLSGPDPEGTQRLARALGAAARSASTADATAVKPAQLPGPSAQGTAQAADRGAWADEEGMPAQDPEARPEVVDNSATLHRVAAALAAPEVLSAGLSREHGDDREMLEEPPRVLETWHETVYTYTRPVEHSAHLFRLRPVHDDLQEVLDHRLIVRPVCPSRDFPDVFGNHTVETEIRAPYKVLRILAQSRVRIHGQRRPKLRSNVKHHQLPLVWMPWQRQYLTPYLLPPELPESQLRELSAYAMGFAARQDHDLVETLKDINRSIHADYAYVPESTHLATTPWEVYATRRGVCQDFANLYICLARLLDIPARYRVGYIYTGRMYENARQGDASHAWVECYLPRIGWRGFDPTNGTLVTDDHVRVACGRNYRDATPTAGTLYKGGGGESLRVDVKVLDLTRRVEEAATTRWLAGEPS